MVKDAYISIVIPVYNNASRLHKCLDSIKNQNYPLHKVELIIIDNESTDGSDEIAKKFADKFIVQNDQKNPYISRNIGIKMAKGDIIVLLDSTCVASTNWLSSGTNLILAGADVVAGKVIFEISKNYDLGELFDSLYNINNKRNVEKNGTAKGLNLFCKRAVFDKIGLFPGKSRSGEDVLWTKTVSRSGLNLMYCDEAAVSYPSRNTGQLLKKQWRVGRGQPYIWASEGNLLKKAIIEITKKLFPPNPFEILTRIRVNGFYWMKKDIISLIFFGWIIKLEMAIANACSLFNILRSTKKS